MKAEHRLGLFCYWRKSVIWSFNPSSSVKINSVHVVRVLFVVALGFLSPIKMNAEQRITYALSFPEPQTHYIEVSLKISGHQKKPLDLKMPVWTPGSYLVREFARHVESFASADAKVEKLAKNHWRVTPSSNGEVTVTYKVYAYELSVRTSFVDADMALLNGASVFMRLDTKEKLEYVVEVLPSSNWKQINTSLKSVGGNNWKRKATRF
jgi:predicted metalloprotease with PDZ domain